MKRRRTALWLFLYTLAMLIAASSASAQDNQTCMSCHADTSLVMTDNLGRSHSAAVDSILFAGSIHASFQCVDCHTDAKEIPHAENLKKVDCGTCHGDALTAFQAGAHGQALAANDPDAPTCITCHGAHGIRPTSDTLSTAHPLQQPAMCASCHGREDFVRAHRLPGALPAAQYENSVHARALRGGNTNAPSCSNCHRAHDILPLSDPQSPISRINVQATCGTCHGEVLEVYASSIHGERVAQGYAAAPTCNSCHGEHSIQSPSTDAAATSSTRVSQEVCRPCHESAVMNQSFGLPTSQVSSYLGSYHGLAVARGSKIAANCTSCHGVHDIYATYDQRSRVHPANLEATCGNCHPGAGENFARTPVHGQAQAGEPGVVSVVSTIYLVLIAAIVSGMLIHNLIIYISYVVQKYRAVRKERTIQRFSINMVAQHLALFLSFTILVITGFALKYPSVFGILSSIGIDEEARSLIHRIAATVLVAGSLYHLYWILFGRRGRIEFRAMLPDRKDFSDFAGLMRYYLRRSPTKPKFGRYSYVEKAEYWALLWGTAIMTITGFILWFPNPAAGLLGSWAVPIATVIHYYEAILATLSIVVWHFFFTIFHPEEYPMSTVWLNGKVTEEEIKHHRSLYFEDLERARKAAEKSDKDEKKER